MLLILLLSLVWSQQEIPSDFKITSLPFAQSLPQNEMYSGFFPINKSSLQPAGNLFFWLIKSTNLSSDIPLIVWLSGGPGTSSLEAQFQHNGMIKVEQDPLNPDSSPNVTFTSANWVQVGHVLYVDNPIGTGFSYNLTIPLRSTHQEIASDFYNFLQHFFNVFTQFSENPFYLTGDSYAGKYIAYMAEQIIRQNEANPEFPIKLRGIVLGNPFLVPIVQRTRMHNLAQDLGLVGQTQLEQLYELQNQCFSSFSSDHTESRKKCNKVRNFINKVDGDVDLEDVRQLISQNEQPWELYMRGDYNVSVLSAFHVQNSPKQPIFEKYSSQVSKAMDPVFMDSCIHLLKNLMKKVPILMYIGQFDGLDGVEGQREIVDLLHLEEATQFKHRSQNLYQYKNELNQWQIGGYYRQIQNFSWMIVPGAGHHVPETQLNLTVALLRDYINNNHTIPCIDSPAFNCSFAHDVQCDAMNQCSGDNGSCMNGVCRCFNNYFGADCSMRIQLVDTSQNATYNITSYSSIVLQTVPLKDASISMVLASKDPFDLYAMRNASLDDPVPLSNYDVAYKQVKEYLDIPNQNIVEYYSDFILIENTNDHEIVVQLTHKSLVSQLIRIKQDSFFAPFNGGFVLALVFLIVAILSLILNLYLRKRLRGRRVNTYQISQC